MAKRERGLKFTIPKVESLLEVIDDIIPTKNSDWERV
jgi:hypothetical protein